MKTLKPTHANRGIEIRYRKALQRMVDDMQSSIEWWLKAAYRKHPPALVAMDATPVEMFQKLFNKLKDRWLSYFDLHSTGLANLYVKKMYETSERSMMQNLKEVGWAVKFTMTPAMKDALNASISDNVGLIKSIPSQYFDKVEGIVLRNYALGRDLDSMVKELKSLYPAASHRASLIARDQSNKANSVVNRTRSLELGITQAKWLHSHAGRNPRHDHVKANGTIYNIEEGCKISGEYIQPGWMINCRCVARSILPH